MRSSFCFRIIIVIIFFISSAAGYSQQNFKDGYLIGLNADTIKGQINYRNWENNPQRIEFRKDPSSTSSFFSPSDIKAFNVAEENYISEIVTVDESPYQLDQLDHSPAFRLVKDTVFLEVLSTGAKPFYYLKDKEGKVNFFIKINNEVEPLYYKEYIGEYNGVATIMKIENYKDRLKSYLGDCIRLDQKIERMSYTLKDMQTLVNNYYTCKGENPEFKKKIEKNKSEFGIVAGISNTKLSFASSVSTLDDIINTDFPSSTALAAGIFYNIYFSRNLNKFSINTELLYSGYKTKGVYEKGADPNTSSITTTEFGFSYVKLNVLPRFSYPIKKAFVYINGGMSNGFSISETNHQKKVSKFYTTETVKEGVALNSIRKYEQGFIIGIGGKYGKCSLEARFENGNGMSDYSNLRSRANRVFLLASYRIF